MLPIGGWGWRLVVTKNTEFCKVFKRVIHQRSRGGKTTKSQARNKSKHYQRPEGHQVSQTVRARGHACCLSQIIRVSQIISCMQGVLWTGAGKQTMVLWQRNNIWGSPSAPVAGWGLSGGGRVRHLCAGPVLRGHHMLGQKHKKLPDGNPGFGFRDAFRNAQRDVFLNDRATERINK